MFATRAIYHTTTQATTPQLVFGQDAITNIKFEADWNLIHQRKQEMIRQNNIKENHKPVEHEYHVNDKILVRNDNLAKFEYDPWEEPFTIVGLSKNSNVKVDEGVTTKSYYRQI